MLKEFFDAISAQAVKALRPTVIKTENEPAHRYAIASPDGSLQWMEAEPAPLSATLYDLDSVARAAAAAEKEQVSAENVGGPPTIFYSMEEVLVFFDGGKRRDCAALPLIRSPQITALIELRSQLRWMKQKEIIRLLRVEFAGCIPANLVAILRNVKFLNNQQGETTIEQGKTSIGKRIEQSVAGTDVLPEIVRFNVPMFSGTVRINQEIQVALEVDTDTQFFMLIPLSGEIQNAWTRAEEELETQLLSNLDRVYADEKIERKAVVLFGKP